MRYLVLPALVMLWCGMGHAWNIFESTTNWTLGTTAPTVVQTQRHDAGPMVNCLQFAPGASIAQYEIDPTDGEGNLTLWLYDTAIDTFSTSKGYPQWGPKWGVRNSLYQYVFACICRAGAVAYSRGYEVSGSMSPYSYIWYNGATRGVNFKAGWYKWEFDVTFDALAIKTWGPGTVAVTQNYDVTNDIIGAFMGSGANGVVLAGDGASGPETFKFDDASGTGVFAGVSTSTPLAQPYHHTTWGSVKTLFRP
jgi:hypothetical protein